MRLRPAKSGLLLMVAAGVFALFALNNGVSAAGLGGIIISPCALTDDSFEENDTQATAAPIALPFSETHLCSRSGDEDWFSFSASRGGEIQIDVAFAHAGGDINVKLRDPSGGQVAFAVSETDDEKITHTALQSGIYRVLVELWDGSSNEYGLEVTATCPAASVSSNIFSDALEAPLAIPDNDPAGVANCITVADTATVDDLHVNLHISHTYVGDLIVTLIHEDTGTSVALIDRPGAPASPNGCGGDDIEAEFSDGDVPPAEDECLPGPWAILGGVRPNEPLSAFEGESIAGTWTLRVSDNRLLFTGALFSWGLSAGPHVIVPVGLFGDVDNNGTVNAIDAALILQYTAGLTGTLPNLPMADVDDDNAVTAIDAALVLQFVAHLIDHL